MEAAPTFESSVPGPQQSVREISVLWITAGLSCDGESVALTGATQPSIEDIVLGAIPGLPKVHFYNPFYSYENGDEYAALLERAAADELGPFLLVIEGSIPDESNKSEGYWAAVCTDKATGQPIATCDWIDRLAPYAWGVLAVGTCAAYGGIHAMAGNPTGAMGLPDYLGWDWRSRSGVPLVCVPGCPTQPDNLTETLLYLLLQAAGRAPMIPLDAELRPTWLFGETVHQGCDRGGYYEQGEFAEEYGSRTCIVKLGCWGPVVQCNVGKRGWMGGVGGCPNVGGICIGCTMPGFPDKFMPFMDQPPGSLLSSHAVMTYGRAIHALRRFTQGSLNERPRRGTRVESGDAPSTAVVEPSDVDSIAVGAASNTQSVSEAEGLLSALAEVFLPADVGRNRSRGAAESWRDQLGTREAPGVEDRYRILVEQIPAVTFMAYLDRGIGEAYVSPQIEAILGFTQEEWLNDPVRWYHHIHPADKGRWSVDAAQMVLTGEPLRSVYRVLARDGRVVWFHCEARMVRAEDGRPWFIHGVGFDVTGLKRAEETLRESEAMLRELFDSAPDPVIVVDADGRIARVNAQVRRVFGFETEELVGKSVEVLLPERFGRSHVRHRASYLSEPRTRPMGAGLELFCRCKDGREIPVDIMLSPIESPGGPLVIAVVRDITNRKRAEEALKRREEELRALSSSLLSAQDEERRRIARELHDSTAQNLAGLAMNLSFLMKSAEPSPDPNVLRVLSDSRSLAEQCSREVRNLSYLLHPPLLDDLGLAPALRSYISGFSQRTGIEVELDAPPDLGRLAPEVETALFRIVQEGLTNVHRHSGSTRAAIRLTVADDEVRLTVEDDGPQGNARPVETEADGGVRLGVGIPGMRERAQQLGGHMDVAIGEGRGTCVSVTLPRRSGS